MDVGKFKINCITGLQLKSNIHVDINTLGYASIRLRAVYDGHASLSSPH